MVKSFWDRYEHYNPAKEGFGSAQEWADMAEALANSATGAFTTNAAPRKVVKDKKDPDLTTLMLDRLPESVEKLKTAYRNCLHLYHPDHGGNEEQCRLLIEAYQRLLKRFQNAPKVQRPNR